MLHWWHTRSCRSEFQIVEKYNISHAKIYTIKLAFDFSAKKTEKLESDDNIILL